jgi:hypothetical protein
MFNRALRPEPSVWVRARVASATRRLTALLAKQHCNNGDDPNGTDESPERQNDTEHGADGENSHKPRESVTHPETALHDFCYRLRKSRFLMSSLDATDLPFGVRAVRYLSPKWRRVPAR